MSLGVYGTESRPVWLERMGEGDKVRDISWEQIIQPCSQSGVSGGETTVQTGKRKGPLAV